MGGQKAKLVCTIHSKVGLKLQYCPYKDPNKHVGPNKLVGGTFFRLCR